MHHLAWLEKGCVGAGWYCTWTKVKFKSKHQLISFDREGILRHIWPSTWIGIAFRIRLGFRFDWCMIIELFYDIIFTNISYFSIAEPRVLAPRRKRIGQLHPLFQFSNNVSSTKQQVSSIQAKQPPNGQHWVGMRAAEAVAAAAAGRINPYAITHIHRPACTRPHAFRTKGNQTYLRPFIEGGSYLSKVFIKRSSMCLERARVCVSV